MKRIANQDRLAGEAAAGVAGEDGEARIATETLQPTIQAIHPANEALAAIGIPIPVTKGQRPATLIGPVAEFLLGRTRLPA